MIDIEIQLDTRNLIKISNVEIIRPGTVKKVWQYKNNFDVYVVYPMHFDRQLNQLFSYSNNSLLNEDKVSF